MRQVINSSAAVRKAAAVTLAAEVAEGHDRQGSSGDRAGGVSGFRGGRSSGGGAGVEGGSGGGAAARRRGAAVTWGSERPNDRQAEMLQVLKGVQAQLEKLLSGQARLEGCIENLHGRRSGRRSASSSLGGGGETAAVAAAAGDAAGGGEELKPEATAAAGASGLTRATGLLRFKDHDDDDNEASSAGGAASDDDGAASSSTATATSAAPPSLEPRIFTSEGMEDVALPRHTVFSHPGRMRKMTTVREPSGARAGAGQARGLWRGARLLPLHPNSVARMALDALGMVLLAYDSVMVPYMVAWERGLEGPFLLSAWIAVCFWTLDMASNFLTSFTKNDVLVTDWAQIAKQYMRTWLLLDLVVVGIDWLSIGLHLAFGGGGNGHGDGGGAPNSQGTSNLKVMRLLKATRLVRVFAVLRTGRFAQVQDTLMRRAQVMGVNLHCQFVLGISKLVFVIMWLNHIGSCLWWMFLKSGQPSDTGCSWHDMLAAEFDVPSLGESEGMDGFWYLSGLYWSVTAMFSGASFRPPKNSAEVAFALTFIIFGMLFGSTLISSVAAMLVDFQMVQRDQNDKLRTLRKFLRQHQVQPMLSISIQNQVVDRMAAEKRLSSRDVPALAVLSAHLRAALWHNIYAPGLTSLPFLHICDTVDDALIKDLCSEAVATQTVGPGDEIFPANAVVSRAYLVVSGRFGYTPTQDSRSGGGSIYRTQSSNSFIMTHKVLPQTWMCELALWTHWTTQGLAESVTPGELMVVHAAGLAEVLGCHRVVGRIIEDYNTTLCAVIAEERHTLSDLRCQTSLDEDHVICAMPQDSRVQMSLPAVRALQVIAGNNTKQLSRLTELESEIRDGRCYLGSDSGRCVLRVVHVVTLRLFRCDGLLCTKVGEWCSEEGTVRQVRAKLPGTKTLAGEMPKQALERLIKKELEMLRPEVQAGQVEVQVEEAPSESYGVATKYVRTIFTASVGADMAPELHLEGPAGGQLQDLEVFTPRSVDELLDAASVYAWIPNEDFPALATADSVGHSFTAVCGL